MVSPNLTDLPGEGSASADRPRTIRDAVIRLAGNSQDGIQTMGGFLARLAGRTDQDVMTYMTIPSTISGGPSIFQVRMGTGEILTAGDQADVLVAFYQHSYEDHIDSLRPGGVLLYDTDHVTPNPDDKRFNAIGVPDHQRARSRPSAAPPRTRARTSSCSACSARIFEPRRRQAHRARQGALRRQVRGHRAQRHARLRRGLRLPGGQPPRLPLPL